MSKNEDVLCLWLLLFGFIFAFFQIMPALLPGLLAWPLTWGDSLDFLTPFAVIPVAYILYSRTDKIIKTQKAELALPKVLKTSAKVILAVGFLLYVDGHGIHLSSNSIARLLQGMKGSELYRAAYLFDEIISHYIWDAGVFLISLGLIFSAYTLVTKSLSGKNIAMLCVGAAFFGFTFTVNGIEGQTVILYFPAAGAGFLLSLLLYIKRQREGIQNPFLFFFFLAYFISLVLFSYWGISRSGFPQFSELGWI